MQERDETQSLQVPLRPIPRAREELWLRFPVAMAQVPGRKPLSCVAPPVHFDLSLLVLLRNEGHWSGCNEEKDQERREVKRTKSAESVHIREQVLPSTHDEQIIEHPPEQKREQNRAVVHESACRSSSNVQAQDNPSSSSKPFSPLRRCWEESSDSDRPPRAKRRKRGENPPAPQSNKSRRSHPFSASTDLLQTINSAPLGHRRSRMNLCSTESSTRTLRLISIVSASGRKSKKC